MPSNALPPLFANTEDDRGAPVVVLAYIGASITLLVTAIRLFLTIHQHHPFRRDDYFFLTGVALAFVASVIYERAVDAGLGRHASALDRHQLDAYTKFQYAASLLSVFSMASSKISVAYLFERIAPRQDKRGVMILMSCIGAWTVFAVFGTAFSCSGHVYWDAQCSGGGWVAFPIIVTNLITDVMLSFWMVPRIWKLQASMQHRVVPVLLMSSRLLVCVAEVGQLGVLGHLGSFVGNDAPDATWRSVAPDTIAICVVHLSIITATIPRINSFVADIQTRKAGLALTERDYENFKSGSNSASHNRSGNGSKNWSRSRSPANMLHSLRPDQQVKRTNNFRNPPASDGTADAIEMDVRDPVETGSQSSLRGNAVYQKTEFRWEEEYIGPSAKEKRVAQSST